VALCGEPLPSGHEGPPGLTHLFPSPECLAVADLGALGMPATRRRTLTALAQAASSDPHLFGPFATIDEAVARLSAIFGIGQWTAQYVALRALRETDAFPATDIGLLRGAAMIAGTRPSPADLVGRAEPWRPWRAYAAQHLWAADASAMVPHG
jgi:AraC family transcriptional regulator of adaptative response / DNA-3-methyladenine glycosylase II